MKIRELFGFAGIPMAHTAKPQGLKKVTKSYMGKVRTYYEPTGDKFNEDNRDTSADPFKGTAIEGKD
tara:strand:- start:422 stop:622 length:201 start_codon:yes stop_codon:yes gene_type:complete